MPRQSVTLTAPNDDWLKAQVDSMEYHSKSDVMNDLIRKARHAQEDLDAIRAKLMRAEQSGISIRTPEQIRADLKARLTGDV